MYHKWAQHDCRNILAVLEDMPSVKVPIDHLCEMLPRLQPRYYSISSSPKVRRKHLGLVLICLIVCDDLQEMKHSCSESLFVSALFSPAPQVHPQHISITAILVDYDTPTGRHMKGVATSWLKLKQVSLFTHYRPR